MPIWSSLQPNWQALADEKIQDLSIYFSGSSHLSRPQALLRKPGATEVLHPINQPSWQALADEKIQHVVHSLFWKFPSLKASGITSQAWSSQSVASYRLWANLNFKMKQIIDEVPRIPWWITLHFRLIQWELTYRVKRQKKSCHHCATCLLSLITLQMAILRRESTIYFEGIFQGTSLCFY